MKTELYKMKQVGKSNCTVMDYRAGDLTAHRFLGDMLAEKLPVDGLLLISDLSGIEEFLDKLAIRFIEANISFYFLEKPFCMDEINQALLQMKEGQDRRHFGCLRLPRHYCRFSQKPGSILRAARENLGIQPVEFIAAGRKAGLSLSLKKLGEIESDDTGLKISYEEWSSLILFLYEDLDAWNVGFNPWAQLKRVRRALEGNTYPFTSPIALRRGLRNLAKRERIESKFLSISNQSFIQSFSFGG